MPPLVTVVVPSFQQARFLRAAIDSILSQDHAPLEVLVQDGGSTDGSLEILRSYGERIRWRSEKDRGQCDAINRGFRAAQGEILAWLNSDDVYRPGAVRKAVAALAREPQAALVYGEGELIDAEGELLARFPETVPFDLWRLANVADYILQPTVFFRRGPLLASGLLDENLHYGLDWELWLRIGERLPLAYVPEVLAASRVYAATKTSTGGWRRLRELYAILRRHGVRGPSPAAVAHTVTTVVRKVHPSQGPVSASAVAAELPRGLGALARPLLARAERSLRRWLQNAQGLWRDGFVAGVGHLWLPSDGAPARLVVRGRNLGLAGQIIGLSVGRRHARTEPLAAGEPFTLQVDVAPGAVPVKARLCCTRLQKVAPLDPALGARRAGFVLLRHELQR